MTVRLRPWFAALALTGCAAPGIPTIIPGESDDLERPILSDMIRARDLDVPRDDLTATPHDLAPIQPPIDGGGARDLTTSQGGCGLTINEVQTGSGASAADEFVELYNSCAIPTAALDGWKVVYRAAAGTADSASFSFAAGAVIARNAFFVLGGSSYTGKTDGALPSGLSGAGGAVGLRDANGNLIDSVGWGTATNAFVEGSAAAPAPTDVSPPQSIVLFPDGVNSGSNAKDYKVTKKTTPRAPNVVQ